MSALVYNFSINNITNQQNNISKIQTCKPREVNKNSPNYKNHIVTVSSWGSLKLIHR
jgi:hypothetical protein